MPWEFKSAHCTGKLKQCATIIEYLWQVCSNTNTDVSVSLSLSLDLYIKLFGQMFTANCGNCFQFGSHFYSSNRNMQRYVLIASTSCNWDVVQSTHGLKAAGQQETTKSNIEIPIKLNLIDCFCLSVFVWSPCPPPSTSESVRYGLQHHKRSMFSVVARWTEATTNDFKTP